MKEEAIKAPGSTIKQYSIMLQNRVGALTALLGLLDMHGIFCLGFSMQDCHEATIARLIVSDPERTSQKHYFTIDKNSKYYKLQLITCFRENN